MPTADQRAPRVAVNTPLRYRSVSEREWRSGILINISETGLLFEPEAPLRFGMALDMWLRLPAGFPRDGGAQVYGSGIVVRTDSHAHPLQAAIRFLGMDTAEALDDLR